MYRFDYNLFSVPMKSFIFGDAANTDTIPVQDHQTAYDNQWPGFIQVFDSDIIIAWSARNPGVSRCSQISQTREFHLSLPNLSTALSRFHRKNYKTQRHCQIRHRHRCGCLYL